jgi:thioredoxin reductase
MKEERTMSYDVIIIGGSYAGLAAALMLARARRQILVVDAGIRRNRFAKFSHGFLTRDGEEPAVIAAKAREEVLAYKTVDWREGKAISAERTARGFRVEIEGASSPQEAQRLVLATGVVDILPEIPGLAERWGRHVFHCPYCHGYELNQGRIGVLATSAASMHLALLLPDWGKTTLFLNGTFEPDEEQVTKLESRGVTIDRRPIDRIQGELDLVMKDGGVAQLDGLFTMTKLEIAGQIPTQLGCQFDESPIGRTLRTDGMKATTVPGVYACGDAARPFGSVPLAVGDGATAGSAAHQSLIFGAL